MSLTRRISQNTAVQLVGRVLTTAASLGVAALVTRALGREAYGQYTAALAYCQLFAVFADLGVNVYLIKRLSHPEADEANEAGNMFGLRLASTAAVVALGYLAMFILPYSNTVRAGIAILLWSIFAQSVNSLFVSVLQAQLKMQYAVLTDVVGRLVLLGITVAAMAAHRGVLWAMLALTAGSVVNVLATYAYARRFVPFRIGFNLARWRQVLRQSLPIGITSILTLVYFKVDQVLLSILPLHHGLANEAQVGLYGVAYKVLELLLIVPGIFVGSLFPVITTFVATKDQRLPALLQRAFDLLALAGLPITAMVYMLADKIVLLIGGAQFAASAAPLRVLAFAVLLSYFTGLFTYTVLAFNQQRALTAVYLVAAVFNIVANVLLIPEYSYMAAAYTTLATEFIVQAGSFYLCRRQMSLTLSLRSLARLGAVVAVLVALMWLLRSFNLVLNLAIVLPVYAALVLGARLIRMGELKSMVSREV